MEKAKDEVRVAAGHLVCFSRGEYSDYGYQGHFVALENLTYGLLSEVAETCKAKAREENAKDDPDGAPCEYGADGYFLVEMIRRGLLLDVNCYEIHTGSYGELDV